MNLIFASHNPHKIDEARASLGEQHSLTTLASLDYGDEIPETADTLLGNARLKAHTIYNEFRLDCFADDTGLEIEALNGAPGVITARFAGEKATAQQNREKTLSLMSEHENRRATFRTVIVLIVKGREYVFEGQVAGEITHADCGPAIFGYDPIFRVSAFDKTYAELSLEVKARISHRALAIAQMREFLDRPVEVTL